MNQTITLNLSNGAKRTIRRKTRERRTPTETALAPGCSVAMVHRLRRGVIPGVEPLPCSRYGRKFVFRNASIARWQDDNEKRGLRECYSCQRFRNSWQERGKGTRS